MSNLNQPSRSTKPLVRRFWKEPQVLAWAAWAALTLTALGILAYDSTLHWNDRIGVRSEVFLSAVGALVIAAVFPLFWFLQRMRSQRQLSRHMEAMVSLNEVAVAIGARLDQGPKILQQIADASRTLLGFGMSTISLRAWRVVQIIAAGGALAPLVGRRYDMDQLVGVGRVLSDGRPIVIEDLDHSDVLLDRAGLKQFGIRSMLIVPLLAQQRIVGALLLADHRPRRICEADLRLAELWAAQAAVLVLNHKLHDRMQQAIETQQRLREQREAILRHSLAIYTDDSLQSALQRMTDEVPPLLGVDILTVTLATEEPHHLRVMAATRTPLTEGLVGRTINILDTLSADCLASGKPLVVTDAAKQTRRVVDIYDRLQVGAMLLVPLMGQSGVIGKLTLIRHQPGEWSPETVETAVYLGERSAAAIETARLHQQAREDAQTRAMLLRELHHRVKNNLAGIVSLLSINQPELPEPVRQWLTRVTDRIRIMARAHELFTEARAPLPLSLLVQIALSSLSVVKPPGVNVQLTLPQNDVNFEADRAVALVMVLHETCHNAIHHGLGAEGTLRITAEPMDGGWLAIEVIDEGTGRGWDMGAEPSAVTTVLEDRSTGKGVGLGLVRGLVMRELAGRFELLEDVGGGMRARIEFPLSSPIAADGVVDERKVMW